MTDKSKRLNIMSAKYSSQSSYLGKKNLSFEIRFILNFKNKSLNCIDDANLQEKPARVFPTI